MTRSNSSVASHEGDGVLRAGLRAADLILCKESLTVRQSFDRRKIAAQITEFSQYLS
jgi:hypothetical protein